jgi:hypothetical protein
MGQWEGRVVEVWLSGVEVGGEGVVKNSNDS